MPRIGRFFGFLAGFALLACASTPAETGVSSNADSTGDAAAQDTAAQDTAEQDTGGQDDGGSAPTGDAKVPHDCTKAGCDTAGDTACAQNRCDLNTGQCAMKPAPAGTPCSDDDPCSVGDACADGGCKPGKHSACECKTSEDCAPLDDGDPCNGTLLCQTTVLPWRCVPDPASVVSCTSAPGGCAPSACDKKTGKCATKAAADGTPCDDGSACSVQDKCSGGACKGLSICACESDADCALQEDGDPCNGTLYCEQGSNKCTLNAATVVQCPKSGDTACTKSACQPSSGLCLPTAVSAATACDDGDACTTGDHCNGGACASGKNTCLCSTDGDCAKHDDGDLCNGTMFCDKASGGCVFNPASVISCPSVDDTTCAHNVCLPKEGTCAMAAREDVTTVCATTKDGLGAEKTVCSWHLKVAGQPPKAQDKGPFPCDDGDVCTSGEACDGKACKASAVTCLCTADGDCAAKDDGDLCNGTFYCDKSLKVPACVFNPASVVFCSKANDEACLQARCDKKTGACGMQPVVSGQACDDGKPCTVATTCDGKGSCAGGKANPCNDGKLCTVDSCAPGQGCVHVAKSCADGNDCTLDGCDPKTGQCKVGARPDGTSCNGDNDGCTVNDHCKSGTCTVGQAVSCTGKTGICEQQVCQSGGAFQFQCVTVAKKDGVACPDAEGACKVGATCSKGACQPGKKSSLFAKTWAFGNSDATFQDVQRRIDGGLVAVGGRYVGSSQFSGKQQWLVIATDATGDQLWQDSYSSGVSTKYEAAGAVEAADGGAVWVFGVGGTSKGERLVLRKLSAAGKVNKTVVHESNYLRRRVEDSVALVDGGYAIATTIADGSGEEIDIVRVDAVGNWQWSKTGGNLAPRIGAFKNHLTWTGRHDGSKGRWYAFFTDLDKQKIYYSAQPSFDAYSLPAAVAVMPGGKSLLLNTDTAGKGLLNVRVTGWDSEHIVDRVIAKSGARVRGVDIAGPGDLLMAGDTGGSAPQGWIGRLDEFANLRFARKIDVDGAKHGRLRAVVHMGGGQLAAVGDVMATTGVTQPWLVRMDSFGFHSCDDQGLCAKQTFASCDDGKACTTDNCTAAGGCEHAAELSMKCQRDDNCSTVGDCVAGQCQPSEDGELSNFDIRWSVLKNRAVDAYQLQPDGSGHMWSLAGTRVAYSPLSSNGGVLDVDESSACPFVDTGHNVAPLFDKSALLMGTVDFFGDKRGGYCRITKDGKYGGGGMLGTCFGCSKALARAAAQQANGGAVFVGDQVKSGAPTGFVARQPLDSADKAKWVVEVPKGLGDTGLNGVVAVPDGGAVAVGWAIKAGAATGDGLLFGLDSKGKQRFVVTQDAGDDDALTAVTLTHKGFYAAIGWRMDINGALTSWVIKGHASTGAMLWKKVAPQTDLADPIAVIPGPDDGVLVAGDILFQGKDRIFLRRLDAEGGQVWQRTYLGERSSAAWLGASALAAWSGGYMLGGHMVDSGYPLRIRTDKDGHAGCKDGGACVAKKVPDCDDKNACTSDWCDASKGCQHAVIVGCK